MRPKDDTEMENAFNFKEYVPSGRFASHTKSSVHRQNATQEYMIDLVKDGGHPSLTKKKAPPAKKTDSIEFDQDGDNNMKLTKSLFQSSGQQQMNINSQVWENWLTNRLIL